MRYMLLLYLNDRPEPGTPEGDELFGGMMEFARECQERGAFVDRAPLRDPEAATTVRVREGETLVTDGPFAEATEWLAGYLTLDCRDLDEALELAGRDDARRSYERALALTRREPERRFLRRRLDEL